MPEPLRDFLSHLSFESAGAVAQWLDEEEHAAFEMSEVILERLAEITSL